MFFKLLFLFITVPCAELYLLFTLGHRIGLPATLAVILLTGALGAWLARQQGTAAIRRIKASLAAGKIPTTELVDGALILAAGLVLITPGFLTDLAGFTLLVPLFRKLIRARAMAFFKRHLSYRVTVNGQEVRRGGPGADDEVIDVQAEAVDDEERPGEWQLRP